ncbi:MAG: hypothetical protein D9C04_02530 [Nitrosopumilus sp. B06]|nr:MAG: hypothetical protein EB828_01625 [Nitrosopumilus sp. D6]RNJ80133.1 MAG: hypothetical protein D9C04_02530 [Nitrosopumilus sp. B06]
MRTPDERWKKMLAVHKKCCQDILGISKSIRYAGVINAYGRTLTGVTSPSAKLLLGPMEVKNEFFVISTMMTQRKDSADKMGKLDHAVLIHQKVFVILVHKDGVTYYVSVSKKEKNLDTVIAKIKKIASRQA